MTDIEVSVVIPTRNRCHSLKETLECLLKQTYSHDKYEIIVCNDNSSDDTEKIVKDLIEKNICNLRYFKIESDIEGPAKVRNFGIINAQAPIIGFTDDDCILPNNWIELAMQRFKENPGICGLYGKVVTFGTCKDKKFKIARRVDVLEDNGSYVTPNVFYKKDILVDVGMFDLEMRYLQDIELGWKVRKKGPILFEPLLLVHHKVHCASIKNYLKRQKKHQYWVLMYKKHPENLEKDGLMLGHVYNKSVFLVLSLVLVPFIFAVIPDLLFPFLCLSFLLYLWAHVLVDKNIKKYPLRILLFPRFVIADIIRFLVSIKASIKYRFLVLF
ncbi:glycosyltransferase [Methanolobus bombayensis]|uniref:glycosyltransferase n=1 Tax=Methanolobus bombayensis TaxID=38023 RepID=UPI001AE6511A|nr:glycosyltransferase family A protein [Methanolobus bombayensis]MBP1910304.1 glycosyltransferase involved in cell wall biosynthesis [Methanolobus bombayensis]